MKGGDQISFLYPRCATRTCFNYDASYRTNTQLTYIYMGCYDAAVVLTALNGSLHTWRSITAKENEVPRCKESMPLYQGRE